MSPSQTPAFPGWHLRRDQPTTCRQCGAPLLLFAALRQVLCRDGHEVWEFTPDGWASRWPHACHGVAASVSHSAGSALTGGRTLRRGR